jgi:hypothetical protein
VIKDTLGDGPAYYMGIRLDTLQKGGKMVGPGCYNPNFDAMKKKSAQLTIAKTGREVENIV